MGDILPKSEDDTKRFLKAVADAGRIVAKADEKYKGENSNEE